MSTHQCRCLLLRHVLQQISQIALMRPNFDHEHGSLAELMRYHFESLIAFDTGFPQGFRSVQNMLYVCCA